MTDRIDDYYFFFFRSERSVHRRPSEKTIDDRVITRRRHLWES